MLKSQQQQTEKGKQYPRRDFLQLAGLGLLGASVLPSFLPEAYTISGGVKPPTPIALQLYTVRNEIQKDIAGTLKRIAAIGFEYVETAFWPTGISMKQAAQYIRDAGLTVCSAHIELPIGNNKQQLLDAATTYGCKRMIWHGWPEDKRYSSLQGTKELVSIYNEASQFAQSNGLQFGLHNHWWEFRNKVNGRYVYEILLEELHKDIFFEIDTYWVKVAGHDPSSIVSKFGKRCQLLHIKDGPAAWNDALAQDNPDPMTAVGKGSQDFRAIVKAANGNTQWMVVEMDKTATDVFEALQESYDYLIKNKLAKGGK